MRSLPDLPPRGPELRGEYRTSVKRGRTWRTRTLGNEETGQVHPATRIDGRRPVRCSAMTQAITADTAETGGVPEAPAVDVQTVVEALLFASDRPVPASRIAQIVEASAESVRECVEALNRKYEQSGAAFRIEAIARGYQMMTLPTFDRWVSQLVAVRRDMRLSPVALETLAVVAYKQPAMRAQVDSIRGVSSGEVLARLREMNLVKIVGRAEELGRPLLYGTTTKFLETF